MEAIKLLPCPTIGCSGIPFTEYRAHTGYRTRCDNCHAKTHWHSNAFHSQEVWNALERKATSKPPQENVNQAIERIHWATNNLLTMTDHRWKENRDYCVRQLDEAKLLLMSTQPNSGDKD